MSYPTNIQATRSHFILNQVSNISQQLFFLLPGFILLFLASQLSIPMEPVPLTFQSTSVVLLGMLFGARTSAKVILCYLIAGTVGLPVFADFHAGPGVILGPTGGYLIGFLPAAFLCGYLAEKGFTKNAFQAFALGALGVSVIFLFGVAMLSTFVGFNQALKLGVAPFWVTELAKLFVLALFISKLRQKK